MLEFINENPNIGAIVVPWYSQLLEPKIGSADPIRFLEQSEGRTVNLVSVHQDCRPNFRVALDVLEVGLEAWERATCEQ